MIIGFHALVVATVPCRLYPMIGGMSDGSAFRTPCYTSDAARKVSEIPEKLILVG